MILRYATKQDKTAWIELADEVALIFGNPNMSHDPAFLAYTDGKIKKSEALIAVDEATGMALGFIGFSKTHNRITWLGVFEKCRNQGVGKRLLSTALSHLDHTKNITVDTYRDDYPAGLPARKVYHDAGFIDVDNTIADAFGNPRCKMLLAPTIKLI